MKLVTNPETVTGIGEFDLYMPSFSACIYYINILWNRFISLGRFTAL